MKLSHAEKWEKKERRIIADILIQVIDSKNLPEDFLDELVVEIYSSLASETNNQGTSAQLEFLLQHMSTQGVMEHILEDFSGEER